MKLFFIIFLLALTSKAEEIRISTSGGKDMVFFNLADKSIQTAEENTWQLAFKAGAIAGTIRSNSNVNVYEAIELTIDGFKTPIELATLQDSTKFKLVYNSDINWKLGAFNDGGAPEDDYNYGWGSYVQGDGIYGTKLYVLEITVSGKKSYFQFVINSVLSSKYSIAWSNLDGTEDKTFEVDKSKFSDKLFAYFNIFNGELLNLEPVKNNWDLLFTNYITPIQAGPSIMYYPVSGILQNINTWVAELEGDVASNTQTDNYSTDINTIGYDWKTYSTGYVIEDRTYFAQRNKTNEDGSKSGDGDIYRIRFTKYEGGSEKASTFDISSPVNSVNDGNSKFVIYPSIISSNEGFNIVSSDINENCKIQILSLEGKLVYSQDMFIGNGLKINSIDKSITPGMYFVNIISKNNILTQKLIVK